MKIVIENADTNDFNELAKMARQGKIHTFYMTDEEERPQGEWIPVSERLPEQANQSYLVTVDYGNGLICACQRFFFSLEIGWNDDCVIAWQPLPEPYKVGGEKE